MKQTSLFDAEEESVSKIVEEPSSSNRAIASRRGSFTDNVKLPIHRWYRYSAGFSAEWAVQQIKLDKDARGVILDPFAGSGTSLLAAQQVGVESFGFETHPFVLKIGWAKLEWNTDGRSFLEDAGRMCDEARKAAKNQIATKSTLLQRCYSAEALKELEALRNVFNGEYWNSRHSKLLWMALTGILRLTSEVGTAPWQYLLPNKKKARVSQPYDAFLLLARTIAHDIEWAKKNYKGAKSELVNWDARAMDERLRAKVSLVITSPPYPNNYDYADATRLELTFWGDIERWADLHTTVRQHLIRSCSQHSAKDKLGLDELLSHPGLEPIAEELGVVCRKLEEERETRGGKKTYHTMIAAYFCDLAEVWLSLGAMVQPEGKVLFVVGDSAPYGVYVPVDKWLGRLALAAGFKRVNFDKFRDRNVKWKNRKHRVPLKEGVLCVEK